MRNFRILLMVWLMGYLPKSLCSQAYPLMIKRIPDLPGTCPWNLYEYRSTLMLMSKMKMILAGLG
jgi:hypothetical protein